MAGRRHGRNARRAAHPKILSATTAADDVTDPGDGAAVDLSTEMVDEITWYMREHKVSRADLATALGVTPGRVSQILSGRELLTPRTLSRVLAALGARVEITLVPAAECASRCLAAAPTRP